jgi:hypothetical protein
MKRIILLSFLLFSACQAQNADHQTQVQNVNSTISSSKVNDVQPKVVVNDQVLISPNGIGKAKLGMTLGQLKEISDEDTKFEVIPSFMVDINAIAVSQDNVVQYYILCVAGTTSHPDQDTPTDQDPINILVTDNNQYSTQAGVKVGMPIQQAEEIYGDATLAYNTEGESREYITFGAQNPQNMRFRASFFKLISDGLGFSGIYPEYPGVAYTTDKYREDAAIAAIEVSCVPDSCPE